ncbi:MAG: phosphate signaling complex protein PhoU [Methanosarcinales archaeon]|nr:phosphate signaling complex protein PhoU [ANME-2 cluster archaeon]MDF1532759.1 phosphate signaling complex protein PhoU [ANME-2 cluster archaeon]MDW7775457.1 phosphate signaling complex protein PhoU [Methanosarcinales archaeon]
MTGKEEDTINDIKQDIIHDLVELGEHVKVSIDRAVISLKEQDTSMADKVIGSKKEINDMSNAIEDKCTRGMTLKVSPLQLRTFKGILKMIIDLESIFSLAVEIALITKVTYLTPHIKPLVDIPRMSDQLHEMMDGSFVALKNQDVELAKSTALKDNDIDALFDQIRRELITYMMEDPKKIANASHLTFVARYLERMGDHVNNLCESVVYIVTGEKVDLN